MANERLERFVALMRSIFELDKSDLDFGIYRIMNLRKAKIEEFLTLGLPKKVQETLAPFASNDAHEVKAQLAEIEASARQFGVADIATLPEANPMRQKYQDLQHQLASGTDLAGLETDVYSALFSFFNRYYDEGDFISKRRYKEGVYAIPYEGEEVKLHWANQDQYYIKTSENFKDYTFIAEGVTVHFRLVDATTEQNNNKESDDSKRTFMLYTEDAEHPDIHTFDYDPEKRELIIRFVFDIPEDKKRKYKEENYAAIKQKIASDYEALWSILMKDTSNDPKKPRTLLMKHLDAYVAKNTFDYFIHKDLGGFLRRELDFYIKSEVMHLDDLDTDNEQRVNTYLAKVKAIKRVGHVIIDFLAQLEDFQKKLWLKKKFVVETNWCITLDHIDEDFWPEIIANKAQIQEWIDMYAIDEIKGDMATVGFSLPLSMDFLRQNQNLIVDTKHFSQFFRDKLVASIDDLDEKTNGFMIWGDNSQALRFIQNKYRKKIQTVYIDPPYNTVYSEILYKNNYKHSSWLSMLNNTFGILPSFFREDYSFGIAIDDYEFVNLAKLLDSSFPNAERSIVVVNHHPQGAGGRLSRTHEYYILLSDSKNPAYLGEPLEDRTEDRSFMRSGTGENNYRQYRWKSFYALLMDPITRKIVDVEDPVPLGQPYPTGNTVDGLVRIYPVNSKGEERVWRSSYLTGRYRAQNGELIVSEKGAVYQTIEHIDSREVLFSNWTDAKFNAGIQGANLLRDMGLGGEFDYPKSIKTLETGIWAQTYGIPNSIVLDYFAGSGTTGHAVININRAFGGNRKYILVEMGNHFQKATKPRIQKAIYAQEWKNSKPKARNTGISHIMKYIRLENYEDALSNIEMNSQQGDLLSGLFGDEYLIHYMMDFESSKSMLDVDAFKNPFEYRMKITENNEAKLRPVDVVETFNYLIGLSVVRQGTVDYFSAQSDPHGAYEGAVRLIKDNGGEYGFQQIEGTLPDGRKALVIWRTVTGDLIKSNAALDAYFSKHRINPQDREYDVIYVNGDSNLENLRMADEQWKVVMTELEFKSKMFEEE